MSTAEHSATCAQVQGGTEHRPVQIVRVFADVGLSARAHTHIFNINACVLRVDSAVIHIQPPHSSNFSTHPFHYDPPMIHPVDRQLRNDHALEPFIFRKGGRCEGEDTVVLYGRLIFGGKNNVTPAARKLGIHPSRTFPAFNLSLPVGLSTLSHSAPFYVYSVIPETNTDLKYSNVFFRVISQLSVAIKE